jgi:3-oxoacyl-[acyl-carrier protein] reductase
MDLTNKVALITGASRGIGRAIAINLASRGCSILGTCATSEGQVKIEALRYEDILKDLDLKIIGVNISIQDPKCAETIADILDREYDSRVDIFINNAADPNPGVIGELPVEGIQKSLVGNIQTPVLIVEELVKRRVFKPDSRIIYISSIRSRQPWADQLMYSAGKSAGESLCRTWAEAFGGRDERVWFYIFEYQLTSAVFVHGRDHGECGDGRPHTDGFSDAVPSRSFGQIQTGVYPITKHSTLRAACRCS